MEITLQWILWPSHITDDCHKSYAQLFRHAMPLYLQLDEGSSRFVSGHLWVVSSTTRCKWKRSQSRPKSSLLMPRLRNRSSNSSGELDLGSRSRNDKNSYNLKQYKPVAIFWVIKMYFSLNEKKFSKRKLVLTRPKNDK